MKIMMIAHDAASSTTPTAVAHEQRSMELMKMRIKRSSSLTVFKTCKLSGCK